MKKSKTDFTWELITQKWNFLGAIVSAFGVAGGITTYTGLEKWGVTQAVIFTVFWLLLTALLRCVSFAYAQYNQSHMRIKADNLVAGEGLNKGVDLIVLEYREGFTVGQLITLYCSSSGADQPLFIAEIVAIHNDRIHAINFAGEKTSSYRKYFEEASRKEHLYAVPLVTSLSLNSLGAK